MKKRSLIPQTKVKNPEPKEKDDNWVIWAAWADRITFEEIKEKTGKTESEVIKLMRKNLTPASLGFGENEFITRALNIEKNLNLPEKNSGKKLKLLIYFNHEKSNNVYWRSLLIL